MTEQREGDSSKVEELTNEVDIFIQQHTKAKKGKYEGKLYSEQRQLFLNEKIVPLETPPEKVVSSYHNPITHTAKVTQTSSSAHVLGKTNAPLPEGYVSLSSTKTRETRDYGGAAKYSTISKIFEGTIDGENKIKDLLEAEDRRLKDFFCFDEERWQHLLQINKLSNEYYAKPKPDALAKQVLLRVGEHQEQYLNLTIVPSPILLFEVNERIKERTQGSNGEWLGRMAEKRIGGENAINASRLISKVSGSRLRILPGQPFQIFNVRRLERYTRSRNFFWGVRYYPTQHRELFQSVDRLIEVNEREGWTPNQKVQDALNHSFAYILEQMILVPALSLQSQEPGWSDSDLVRLPEYQRRWLDPQNPQWETQIDYKDKVADDAISCINRLYKAHRINEGKDAIELLQDKYVGRFKEVIKRSL